MKLTVYGPGCPRCQQTEEVARQAVAQAGVEAQVEKVTDIGEMAKAGVLMTPAVAIDGKIVISGKVPEVTEVVTCITSAMAGQ
jgi:small redox-active disulfide protein 2